MNEKCFALGRAGKHAGRCLCREGSCPGYAACPFYKPVWKMEQDKNRKYARLILLPEKTQRHISRKYYRGRMPWRETME